MNWDSLFEMLKQFFANDPTMILLLTLGFFFLKQIWPQPASGSKQVMDGYAERIRKALELGDQDAAKRLADAGIADTAKYLQAEATPKPRGILDVITGIFGNGTLMPLLMIGGVFLLLMVTQGGGCKASAEPGPLHMPTGSISYYAPAIFELDRACPRIRPAVWKPDAGVRPWAWAGDAAETVPSLSVDSGGGVDADGPAGGDLRQPGAARVVCLSGAFAADRGRGCCGLRWQAGQRAPALSRLAFRRGQPIRNLARGAARLGRWIRLPGRPFARLLRRGH